MVPTWFEILENRRLLSATPGLVMQPALTLDPLAATTAPQGYTPQQIDKAYGFDSITLNDSLGGSLKGDGSGQTIAIVDAYNDPNIANDLKTFDKQFSLSNPKLTVVNQDGSTSNLPKTDAGWAQEISLDVEWAHSVAPKANIMLVEAKSASLNDLLTAVNTARNAAGVSVVSMSWGTNEFFNQGNFDSYFTTPAGHQGVTFVASSGDQGSWFGPTWPSVSKNVLAVGGTTLALNSNGTIANETAWSGSGGGISQFESQPQYQTQYNPNFSTRGGPDVSINADPNTGYSVYDSLKYQGQSGWMTIGGTSAGSPQWAALIAIANQGRVALGGGTLDGATGTLPGLYSLYTDANYAKSFNDITRGASSWWYGAGPGWDPVTGFGSPKGNADANALAHFGLNPANAGTITTPNTNTTTTHHNVVRHVESASVSASEQSTALPAPQQAASLFSAVEVHSTTADEVAENSTTTHSGGGQDPDGEGSDATGLAGTGRGGAGHGNVSSIVSNRSNASSPALPIHMTDESESNPLRHLMSRTNVDQTATPARPGKMYSPSSYDAATLAATEDGIDDMLTWKQIAAVVGTTILVGSYAANSYRQKREIQTI
jgi:subtilase family serine protease